MDTLGIIRQIEADPALRSQLRAVLLGDELLELPRIVRQLGEDLRLLSEELRRFEAAVDRRFAALEADVGTLKTDVAELKTDVAELKTDVAELKTDVAELKTDVATLKTDVATLKADMGDVKGQILEGRLYDNPARFVPRRFATRTRLVSPDRHDELLDGLSTPVAEDLERADALLECRLRDGTDALVVVEVSFNAHVDDVDRAARRAAALVEAGVLARGLVVSRQTPHHSVLDAAATQAVAVVGESAGLLVPAGG